jgi:hypothetical protein
MRYRVKAVRLRREVVIVREIERMIKELPPELVPQVEEFVASLLQRRAQKQGRRLRQDWAGALRDFRDQYTSQELQKKAVEWREN